MRDTDFDELLAVGCVAEACVERDGGVACVQRHECVAVTAGEVFGELDDTAADTRSLAMLGYCYLSHLDPSVGQRGKDETGNELLTGIGKVAVEGIAGDMIITPLGTEGFGGEDEIEGASENRIAQSNGLLILARAVPNKAAIEVNHTRKYKLLTLNVQSLRFNLYASIPTTPYFRSMTNETTLDPALLDRYEPVIGLEVHAQLLTSSKAFSRAAGEYGAAPNTNTDPVVLGHPGTLPVVNRRLVEYILRMGLATNCSIRRRSRFARKNYFYPDLPKGYQISQFEDPICYDGWLEIEEEDGSTMKIGITRIHMEEDAGKSIHDLDPSHTLVDLNRAGAPLIEIVSEPDIRSSAQAYQYLMQIKGIVTYLGVCSGNMEEGALRCDANVSVRRKGAPEFGVKTEVKNMNSFRNVERAIEHEIARQIEMVERGERVAQETRLWDASAKVTRSMRSKEFAHDYRYFPEPDLPAVVVTEEMIEGVRAELPELAIPRKRRFASQYGLPAYDAGVLTESRALGDYFEQAAAALSRKDPEAWKVTSNIMMTEVLRILTETHSAIEEFPIEPVRLAGLVDLFAGDVISSKNVKDIFAEMLTNPKSAEEISREMGFVQISDSGFLEDAIAEVLGRSADQIAAYRSGKQSIFGYFVGETMKLTKGKANPKMVTELLQAKLNE